MNTSEYPWMTVEDIKQRNGIMDQNYMQDVADAINAHANAHAEVIGSDFMLTIDPQGFNDRFFVNSTYPKPSSPIEYAKMLVETFGFQFGVDWQPNAAPDYSAITRDLSAGGSANGGLYNE